MKERFYFYISNFGIGNLKYIFQGMLDIRRAIGLYELAINSFQ